MPGLFYQPLSRKEFLTTVARGLGAVTLTSVGSELVSGEDAATENDGEGVHLALLSDTHIPADPANGHRGFRPVENLRQVVPQVVAAKPEAVIINGDAARLTGEREDYDALKELLAPVAEVAPVAIGLGNHDDRKNFFKVFPLGEGKKSPVGGKHVAVIERAGLRFIVLDSLLYVDKVAGLLGKSQRTWLTDYLAKAEQLPTVLFVHHTLGDGDGDLLDVDRLFRILEPHRQVKAIFYGHSHRYAAEKRDNLWLINLPAVGYNFNDNQPVGWLDAHFSAAGVRLTLSAIGGNRQGDGETQSIEWVT